MKTVLGLVVTAAIMTMATAALALPPPQHQNAAQRAFSLKHMAEKRADAKQGYALPAEKTEVKYEKVRVRFHKAPYLRWRHRSIE